MRRSAIRPPPARVVVSIILQVDGEEKIHETIARALLAAQFQAKSRPTAGRWDAGNCVRTFVAQRCRRKSSGAESASALFAAFQVWAGEMARPAITKKAFGRAMGSLGFLRKKSSVVVYRGIELRARAGIPAPQPGRLQA